MRSEVKREIENLTKPDLYSLAFYGLYKLTNLPGYSSLSEMAYMLSEDSMLRLCEAFGGQTLTIPTVDELQDVMYALVLYQYVNGEGIDYKDACDLLGCGETRLKKVKTIYRRIADDLDKCAIGTAVDEDDD